MVKDYSKSIYVVSAPSGGGKTTLNRRLIGVHPNFEISVSYTTRAMRSGESPGVDYNFIESAAFQQRIKEGNMLEWAEVHGNLYGTSWLEVQRILNEQHKVILEIDVQGWQKAAQRIPTATSVFIIPPSVKILWERLERRGTDGLETRLRRLKTAEKELAQADLYEHFIINDDVEKAYQELENILVRGNHSTITRQQGQDYCGALLEEMASADWLKALKAKVVSRS